MNTLNFQIDLLIKD